MEATENARQQDLSRRAVLTISHLRSRSPFDIAGQQTPASFFSARIAQALSPQSRLPCAMVGSGHRAGDVQTTKYRRE
jgi:hypothetical protein